MEEDPVPTQFGNLNEEAKEKYNALVAKGVTWLEEPIKKGTKYFKDQRKEFRDLGKQGLADRFRASAPGTDVDPDIINGLVGMKKPPIPAFAGSPVAPVFTWLIDNNKPHLYQDDDFTIFLNASFPYLEQYAPDKATSAGMSLVHMLACPNARIYNAVSLNPDDGGLLERMKTKVEELMDQEYNEEDPDNFKNKCLMALDAQMTGKVPSDLVDEYAKDKEAFKHTKSSQMRFYFHIHPNHSVGHLHMHCLQNNIRTSYLHEHKNAKYADIIKVLNEESGAG